MIGTIYYTDFVENGDNYKLCFYQSYSETYEGFVFTKLHPKTLIYNNELSFSQNMPQDLPVGMQQGDILKLKINLIAEGVDLTWLIDGYNKDAGLVNGKHLRNNVWYLLKEDSPGWDCIFHGFQQIKDTNETTQEKETELLFDIELISAHRFLMEKVTTDDLLHYTLLELPGAEWHDFAMTNDLMETTRIHTQSRTPSFYYFSKFKNIIGEIESNLNLLLMDFTSAETDFSIENTMLDHITFNQQNLDGTFTPIDQANNKELLLMSCITDTEVTTTLDPNTILGGLLSSHQEKGWNEFENVANLLIKLLEQIFLRGKHSILMIDNSNEKTPYFFKIKFEDVHNISVSTTAQRSDFTNVNQKQGELLSKYNCTKKEVNEDDFTEIAIKNAGIFNEKSFEMQEVLSTNYYCVASEFATYRYSPYLDGISYGTFTRILYDNYLKVFDKVSLSVGDVSIDDTLSNLGHPDFLDVTPSFGLEFNLFHQLYNKFMLGRQNIGGLSYVSLLAYKWLLDKYFIVEATTKLTNLELGKVLHITDGLFYNAFADTYWGAGYYIVTGIEKTFWGETKVKLFRRAV